MLVGGCLATRSEAMGAVHVSQIDTPPGLFPAQLLGDQIILMVCQAINYFWNKRSNGKEFFFLNLAVFYRFIPVQIKQF